MAVIVVGVDGSKESETALRWVIGEARVRHASVRAVAAWRAPQLGGRGYIPPDVLDPAVLARVARERLDAALVNVPGANGVEREVAEGPAASVLVEAADGADLLVVGSRGRGGFKGLLLGSVSQECVQHARCPVAISGRPGLAGEDVGSTGRILVGLDGSEGARRALDWASGEARLRGARLRLLLAWQFPLGLFSEPGLLVDGETVERLAQIGREMLDEMCQGLGPVLEGLEVERVAVQGPPAAALVAGSADADLLVVGTRGHGGFAGLLLGSVSQACAHHAVCPLVVVPPPRG